MDQSRLVFATLVLAATAAAQGNLMYHYDGVTEFTSRGVGGVNQKAVLQRVPADQICGATMLLSVMTLIQDQNALTPEGPITLECRGDDPINSPRPDMAAPPLGVLPLGMIAFPGAGVVALKLNIVLPAPLLLPNNCATPQGDIYLGFALPAQPAWPADGISVHISVNELICPLAVPYPANPTIGSPAHATNLGWDVGYVAGVPVNVWLGTLNRAWRIAGRYREDALQPFAANPRFPPGGLNPNFGYPGIWPDAGLGDALGFNAQSGLPVGSPYFLLIGPQACPTIPLPPAWLTADSVQGLCIVPAILALAGVTVPPGPCLRDAALGGVETCVSQVDFGPLLLPFAACGNGTIYAQAVGLAGGGLLQVSTGCRVDL